MVEQLVVRGMDRPIVFPDSRVAINVVRTVFIAGSAQLFNQVGGSVEGYDRDPVGWPGLADRIQESAIMVRFFLVLFRVGHKPEENPRD
jgi:hypothetical protein